MKYVYLLQSIDFPNVLTSDSLTIYENASLLTMRDSRPTQANSSLGGLSHKLLSPMRTKRSL